MSHIIINALGVSDSGGIAVLSSLLNECSSDSLHQYSVFYNDNIYTAELVNNFSIFENLNFEPVAKRGFLHRIYYENVCLSKTANSIGACLVYNFSGSGQPFLKVPQITKVHNLIFYSKRLDLVYRKEFQLVLWIRQIYLKRVIFKLMLSRSKHIEIQSNHVKNCLLDFMGDKGRLFYVKSDVDVSIDEFCYPKHYDFSKRIKFLYIVGPHFEYLHKNLPDFIGAMIRLDKQGIDFEIDITLTYKQLTNSSMWESSLNSKTNFLGYISERKNMLKLFRDNTILISTSIVETLGLHVIEGIKNGIITIAPDEAYASEVYGKNMFKYGLFDKDSLVDAITDVIGCDVSHSEKILLLQDGLRRREAGKLESVLDVFDEVVNV